MPVGVLDLFEFDLADGAGVDPAFHVLLLLDSAVHGDSEGGLARGDDLSIGTHEHGRPLFQTLKFHITISHRAGVTRPNSLEIIDNRTLINRLKNRTKYLKDCPGRLCNIL